RVSPPPGRGTRRPRRPCTHGATPDAGTADPDSSPCLPIVWLASPGRPRLRRRASLASGRASLAGGELAAGAVDLAAPGVSNRRRNTRGPKPADELPLDRFRACVPPAARCGVERNEIDMRELAGQ